MTGSTKEECPRSIWLSMQRTDSAGAQHFLKFKTRCKTWSCPYCGRIQKDLLSEKIRKFFAKKNIYHYTFTIRNTGQSPEASVKHGKHSFSRFRKLMNRRYGRFAYVYFVEFTQRGIVHYHLLSDGDFPKWKVKELWFKSTRNSYMVEKSKFAVKHGIVRQYVLKYVLKQIDQYGKSVVHGQKIYAYSSHFFNPPKLKLGWELIGLFEDGIEAMVTHYTAIREWRIQSSEIGRPPPMLVQKDGYSDCFFYFSDNTPKNTEGENGRF